MTMYMIDIETTGLEQNCEILQCAVLEMIPTEDKLYLPGNMIEFIQFQKDRPTTDFQKEHQQALFRRCNTTPYVDPKAINHLMTRFFLGSGSSEQPRLCGWNIGVFDLDRLKANGWLMPDQYHFRTYEMAGAIELAIDISRLRREDVLSAARFRSTDHRKLVADRGAHDAVYDCFQQLDLLNGLIKVMRAKEY